MEALSTPEFFYNKYEQVCQECTRNDNDNYINYTTNVTDIYLNSYE